MGGGIWEYYTICPRMAQRQEYHFPRVKLQIVCFAPPGAQNSFMGPRRVLRKISGPRRVLRKISNCRIPGPAAYSHVVASFTIDRGRWSVSHHSPIRVAHIHQSVSHTFTNLSHQAQVAHSPIFLVTEGVYYSWVPPGPPNTDAMGQIK